MDYVTTERRVVQEISDAMEQINPAEVELLIGLMEKADKVFFVGVGRVMLSLQAIAKRLAHLGINTVVVGQITEPAITENDLLIVGSGSGETLFPLGIARKAKTYKAMVVHIGANPDCSMKEYRDHFIRIPVSSKLHLPDEIVSRQPMTSLFEQSLLLVGDIIALMIIEKRQLNIHSLWQFHANLE
ncbi:6-phospho-3-hexuloisomerase [Klebsiella michiganensis]|uniref:6-phospho-3-hexuloisomerase n=1 Tax=Klebsiella TaxID=570 RepID=UPI000D64D0AB|nr:MULTISPECIES: 6-phospho-3-hexuloisomerase [Klebsiella]MBK0162439.1 SIS domain-containing protein [Klebsiella sp. S69]HBQ5643484.1 SIS domain-containing protein [Klebsiella variicola]